MVGCAGYRARPAAVSPFAAADRPFLTSPVHGYPRLVPLQRERELVAVYRELVEAGALDAATASASQWLAADPGLHPARVLLAMADFGAGRWRDAVARLEAVTAELPSYVAAQLLLGRAHERLEEIPAAVAAYAAVAGTDPLAAASVTRLRPRAVEIVGARFAEALARGRLDVAREALRGLQEWAPTSPVALEAELALAEADGEPERALAAARRLAELDPADRGLAERLAVLELAVGDAGRGLDILEGLAAADPADTALAERLTQARFRWRMQLLPEHVRDLGARTALTRGDFAVLVYWLFPSIRHGRAAGATIASDILDSPVQREIARVINLGLLGVDPVLHLFHPHRTITRQEAIEALLRLLLSQQPQPACVGTGGALASVEGACAAARRCELIAEVADCLPSEPLSGAEALRLGRRGGGLLADSEDSGG